MSLYKVNRHYVNPDHPGNPQLMGRSDMVLRHIAYSNSSGFHAATRSFYGRALGTAEYGFLTILRHPVDRYISDFYYFNEPEARKANKPITLQHYAANGSGANRMAHEFAIRDVTEAVKFAAGEMQADGVFLTLELFDYGLALLAAHCGWRLSQVMHLQTNANTEGKPRYDGVALAGRPTVTEVEEQDPGLMARIAEVNSVDAVLYGAATSQLLARLQPHATAGAAAAASAVMAAAVRLTAARKGLEAECRAVSHGGGGGDGHGEPAGTRPANISAEDLAGLCAWYELLDLVYQRLPSNETGRVALDTALPSSAPPPVSWPVGRLLRLADEYLARYDNNSVSYYHTLLAVRVQPPTAAEAKLVYGKSSGSSSDSGGGEEALAAAVQVWVQHHADEGLHHLVLLLDGASDDQQEQIVRQAATKALGLGDGRAGGSARSYTSFSIMRCGGPDDANAAGGGGDAGGRCDTAAAAVRDLASRSRWSAELPGLTHFLYGTRGSVRSVLLSHEALLRGVGAMCAPLVRWQTSPLGSTMGASGGNGGGEASCLRAPCSLSLSANGSLPCVMIQAMPLLGFTRPYSSSGEPLPEGQTSYSVPYRGPEQHRLEVARLEGSGSGAGEGAQEGTGAVDCSAIPRPRLHVPWCE